MATYVILSKLSPEGFRTPSGFRQLAETVSQRIKADCPNVRWKDSYAVMGRFDVVDVARLAPVGGVRLAIRRLGFFLKAVRSYAIGC